MSDTLALQQLLLSPDASSVQLALTLLKNNREKYALIKALEPTLAIVSSLNTELPKNIKNALKRLIESSPSRQQIPALAQKLVVFTNDKSACDKKTIAKLLAQYKTQIAVFEPFILSNSFYANYYAVLGQDLYYYYDLSQSADDVSYFLGNYLQQYPYENVDNLTIYLGTYLAGYFADDQHLEEVPRILQELLTLIERYPNESDLYLWHDWVGILYDIHLNDTEKAKPHYLKCIELSPDDCDNAANNLAAILHEQEGDWQAAKPYAELAVQLNPNDPIYLETLARIEAAQGLTHYKNAIALLRKSLSLDKKNAPKMMLLADWYQTLGKSKLATTWYQKALALLPKHASLLEKLINLHPTPNSTDPLLLEYATTLLDIDHQHPLANQILSKP